MLTAGTASILPPLSATECAHSERLVHRIAHEIEISNGFIGFDRYMEMALYEPGLGYYSAGALKFGCAGDFITAPESGPLFGVALARYIAPIMQACGLDTILELGGGTGRLAVAIRRELAAFDTPLKSYLMIELSADLRARQRETIAKDQVSGTEFSWLDALPRGDFSGIVIANEVIDALPVQRFEIRDGVCHELGVTMDSMDHSTDQGVNFSWATRAASAPLSSAVTELQADLGQPFAEGYQSEINRRVTAWLEGLSAAMVKGAVLLIDYGYPRHEYYHPERGDGTLICHFRHCAHADPFTHIGLQDLSAFVDFTSVAEAALSASLEIVGYTSQTQFLLRCGLDEILQERCADPDYAAWANAAKQLTLPGEMGEKFKALVLAKNINTDTLDLGPFDALHRL